jgi:hypothetical protein
MRQDEDVIFGVGGAALEGSVKGGRNDEGSRGDCHERCHGRCNGLVEPAFSAPHTGGDEAAAEDEEDVGKDGTEHAGLDNADLALSKRNNADLYCLLAIDRLSRPMVRLTINSTAFPKVAFINPPTVCPSLTLNSSVAKLNKAANGTMAMKLMMKTVVGFAPVAPSTIPTGTSQPGEVDEVHGPAHPGAFVLVQRPAARAVEAIRVLPAGERGALVGRAIRSSVGAGHVVAVHVVAEGAAVFTESALNACNAGTSWYG